MFVLLRPFALKMNPKMGKMCLSLRSKAQNKETQKMQPPPYLSFKKRMFRARVSCSLMGSLAMGLLWKDCGHSAEIRGNLQKYVLLRLKRVPKFCGKSAEILRKFAENVMR